MPLVRPDPSTSRLLSGGAPMLCGTLREKVAPAYDLARDPSGVLLDGATDDMRAVMDHVLDVRDRGRATLDDCVTRHGPTEGNDVALYLDGEEALREAIFPMAEKARESIHVMMYQFQGGVVGDAFVDLVLARAEAGVNVYIACDGEGSQQFPFVNDEHTRMMRRVYDAAKDPRFEGRVHIKVNPVLGSGAFHHKAFIFDAQDALVGATNFDKWSLHSAAYQNAYAEALRTGDASAMFEDTPDANGNHAPRIRPDERLSADPNRRAIHDDMVRLRGPAVKQLQAEFALNWMQLGGELYPELSREQARKTLFVPLDQRVPASERSFRSIDAATHTRPTFEGARVRISQGVRYRGQNWMNSAVHLMQEAQRSIKLEAAYITAPEFKHNLIAAARRGVRVELIVPGYGDRPYTCEPAMKRDFRDYVDAGISVREFTGFNHAKVLVVDGETAHIGSACYGGFGFSFETVATIRHPEFAQHVDERVFQFDSRDDRSRQATGDEWQQLSPGMKALGNLWGAVWGVVGERTQEPGSTLAGRFARSVADSMVPGPSETWAGTALAWGMRAAAVGIPAWMLWERVSGTESA